MKKLIILLLSILTSSLITAQISAGMLRMHGRVENGSSSIKDVDIRIYENNELIREFSNNVNGAYSAKFALGNVYSVEFSKEGFITKSIDVIAKTPDSLMMGMFFFQLDIDLFEETDESDSEAILPSAAKIYLKDTDQGFIYDKRYVRWAGEEYQSIKETK